MSVALYVFTNDLRLQDNPALAFAAEFKQLHLMTVVEQRWFKPNRYQTVPMGAKRWAFLQDGLIALSGQLKNQGQNLAVHYGEWVESVISNVDRLKPDRLIINRPIADYEQQRLQKLKTLRPDLHLILVDNSTLYKIDQAQWLTQSLPLQFTPFKKLTSELAPTSAITTKILLPEQTGYLKPQLSLPNWLPSISSIGLSPFIGGEAEARKHRDTYLNSDAALTYKDTRNEIDGWDNSSKFSVWLSFGFISTRETWAQIEALEDHKGANESTEWLKLELLWREYFQWLALKIGRRLFDAKGLAEHKPLTSHYSQRIQAWRHGDTPYPLVNAIMKELSATGYISNRARQIAASCLVNELQVDWRYGAAWFEQELLDYNVASNWGNWQYIAGVGVDPRGGRHFNLEKQQAELDPDGRYIKQWCGDQKISGSIDHVDAADWPIF